MTFLTSPFESAIVEVPVIAPQPTVPTVMLGDPAKPVAVPVTVPSTLATSVPVAIVILPVASLVAVVVPTTNLSALHPKQILHYHQ